MPRLPGPRPSAVASLYTFLRTRPLIIVALCAAIAAAAHWSGAACIQITHAATALKDLQPSTLAEALALSATAAVLSGIAWQRVITQMGYPCTLRTGLTTYLSAGLGGYVLNSIGPAAGCAASLRTHGVPVRRATLLTLIANALGLCGVLAWTPIGLLALSQSAGARELPVLGPRGPVTAGLALLGLTAGILIALNALASAASTNNRVARFALGPAHNHEPEGANALHYRRLISLIPWTAASWVVGACALYVLLTAMYQGSAPSFAVVIGSAALASTLGSLACFAPEGIGVSESALVILLVHTTSIPAATCVTAALALRAIDPLTKVGLLCAMALAASPRSASVHRAAHIVGRGTAAFLRIHRRPPFLPRPTVHSLAVAPSRRTLSFTTGARRRFTANATDQPRDLRSEAAALFIELAHELEMYAQARHEPSV